MFSNDLLVSVGYLVGTALLCRVIRYFLNQRKPFGSGKNLLVANDMLNTFELCALMAESWCFLQMYGIFGYGVVWFCRIYHYSWAFVSGSTGNICVSFRRFFQRGEWNVMEFIMAALLCCASGFFATLAYAPLVWSMHLSELHVKRLVEYTSCQTDLNVPMAIGFAIEFSFRILLDVLPLLTGWLLRKVNIQWSNSSFEQQVMFLSTLIDTIVACSLLGTTGMYANPINALAQGFFCAHVYAPTFALVYWVGPLLGTYCSERFIEPRVLRALDKYD